MEAVIRFVPDTWRDAIWRPISMAAPDAGVYVEIMAPDIRFAAIVALMLIWLVLARRAKWRLSQTLVLAVFVSAAFVVWLATTGNGRYFIPILFAAGPLCVALIHSLPTSRSFRALIALCVVGVQAFVVHENNPWHWWGYASWNNAPFFEMALDATALSTPSTYVTVLSNSYSLLAPRFPEASRWVNISSNPDPEKTAEGRRIQAMLAASKSLMLLTLAKPDYAGADGSPNKALRSALNGVLGIQHLALQNAGKCRFLPSKGLVNQALGNKNSVDEKTLSEYGFWICPLQYPVNVPNLAEDEKNIRVEKVFAAVENACPRFFQPGEALTARIGDGYIRHYPSADIKLYVLDNGVVLYKYWRAMNPELIGTVDAILADGLKMDCSAIRGRSGLPWERKL